MQERCIRSMLLVSELLSIYFMNFSKFHILWCLDLIILLLAVALTTGF